MSLPHTMRASLEVRPVRVPALGKVLGGREGAVCLCMHACVCVCVCVCVLCVRACVCEPP